MTDNEGLLSAAQLRDLVGEKMYKRGENYHLRDRVHNLAATQHNDIIAWVHGSQRYATRVRLLADTLSADCSCPYPGICKHAIALVLAYLSRPDTAESLPTASENDVRLALLQSPLNSSEALLSQPGGGSGPTTIQAYLSAQSQEELVTLLLEMSQRFSEVYDALSIRAMLTNDSEQLEADVLKRIYQASAEPVWGNRWDRDWVMPDYSAVCDGLALLLERGHADSVVRLGAELLEAGMSQIEQSHDEGELASQLVSCFRLVFKALPQSSLSEHEQLCWAIDALLRDPYDLCYEARALLELPYSTQAWSSVADELLARLGPTQDMPGNFERDYRRQQIADYAIIALDNAEREDEIIPLCEREVSSTGSYKRLVDQLLVAGRRAEAEQWARTGIAATACQYPGISSSLREVICNLRGQAGDWMMVAAMHAETFFYAPSLAALQTLMASAAHAQVAQAVRAAALAFLETGQLPQPREQHVGAATIPRWPLPDTGIPAVEQRYPLRFPQLAILIGLAISENDPDEVLRWYDKRTTPVDGQLNDDMVADAIVKRYPERAAAIWQQLAAAQVALTNTGAYEEAARFLRKLRRTYTTPEQIALWEQYVQELRTANKRKRRLVEILDGLLSEDNA